MERKYHRTADTFNKGSRVLDRELYVSSEIYDKETEIFIHQNPICVGHVAEIPEPGDFFTFDVDGVGLVINRGQNGEIDAIHNACPHRTSRLVRGNGHGHDHESENEIEIEDKVCIGRGKLKRVVVCGYHSLGFNVETGKVTNPKKLDPDPDGEIAKLRLQKSPVHVWNGFIFANLDPNRSMEFDKVFSDLPDLSKYNLADLEFYGDEKVYDIPANWKTAFENYDECKHCPDQHPQLIRVCEFDNWQNDLAEGPVLGGYMHVSGGNQSLTMTGKLEAPFLGDFDEEEKRRAYSYSFSPGNLFLNIQPGSVNVDFIIPITPNRTKVISRWYFKKGAKDTPGYNGSDAIEFWDRTNRQDFYGILPNVMMGTMNRYYNPGPLAPGESLVAAFDANYSKMMGFEE